MNKENKCKDTYGSKLRNLLSPFYNIIQVVHSNSRQDYMSIPNEELLKWLRDSNHDAFEAYKKIIDMSYDELLDETEWEDNCE